MYESLAKDGESEIALEEIIVFEKDVIIAENIYASLTDSLIIITPDHGNPSKTDGYKKVEVTRMRRS